MGFLKIPKEILNNLKENKKGKHIIQLKKYIEETMVHRPFIKEKLVQILSIQKGLWISQKH